LVGLPGASGRIDRAALLAALSGAEVSYRQAPAALTLTQATEYGTLYSPDDLRRLIEPARAAGLRIHLDGARLANAIAAGFDAPLIPRLGVDVVSVGGSKAGLPCAEALVVFDPALAVRIDNRLKQAGQLASKTRFLAAPFLGALESGAWVGRAAHANAMARKLADAIRANAALEIAHPVEANMVFCRVSEAQHETLMAAGWSCYRFDDGSARFVCSWATDEGAVDELAGALADLA
jgi:threonine aldolase